MSSRRKSRTYLVVFLFLIVSCQSPPSGVTSIQPLGETAPATRPAGIPEVHALLFEYFFPTLWTDKLPSRDKIPELRAAILERLFQSPDLEELMKRLTDLSRFETMVPRDERLAAFIRDSGKKTFAELDATAQDQLLRLWQGSSDNRMRREIAALRTFYVASIYTSKLGWEASGAAAPPILSSDVASNWKPVFPKFPPSGLIVDHEAKEIRVAKGRIDYLIVGSGAAGSVLAHELRRNGKRVVVVEKGAFVLPGSMETRLVSELHESRGRRSSTDGGIWIRNASAVGGGTTINVDLAFSPLSPLIQNQLAGWRAAGAIGPKDFSSAEMARAYEWVKKRVGTRQVQEKEINENNRILWEGGRRHGLNPKLYELNTYASGKSPSPVTDKRSSVSAFLLPAMMDVRNPLAVLPETEVLRLVFEGEGAQRRVTGVELKRVKAWDAPGVIHDPHSLALPEGEAFTLRAEKVILSAGALGTATLLMRSGFTAPGLGTGIVLHPSLPLVGLFERRISVMDGTPASVYVDHYASAHGFLLEAMSAPPHYVAVLLPGNGKETLSIVSSFHQLGGFGVMLVDTPSSGNRLFLDSEGNPQFEYALGEEDKRRFRFGVAEAARILFKAGARKVFIPSNESMSGEEAAGLAAPLVLYEVAQTDAIERRLDFVPNRTWLSSSHLQGTVKMGLNPESGVVSPQGKVWGLENLYVCDASLFPSSVGANPMQTIYTVAKMFADAWNPEVRRAPRPTVPGKPAMSPKSSKPNPRKKK